MAWLAQSLVNLRREVDAAWPGRSRAIDGWVNNSPWVIHQNDHAVAPNGIVHAIDVTAATIEAWRVVDACRRHPDVCRYVIFNRKIYQSRNGMVPEDYHGTPNPHTDHVHVSIEYTAHAEQWNGTWGLGASSIGAAPAQGTATLGAVSSGPWDFSPEMFALAARFAKAGDNLQAAYFQLLAMRR